MLLTVVAYVVVAIVINCIIIHLLNVVDCIVDCLLLLIAYCY